MNVKIFILYLNAWFFKKSDKGIKIYINVPACNLILLSDFFHKYKIIVFY